MAKFFTKIVLCTLLLKPDLRAEIKTGDFLFMELDCGELCQAIEDVTLAQFGVTGPRLSHVGIVERRGDTTWVWEAWPQGGVQATPLKVLLDRKHRRSFLAPLQAEHRDRARSAIDWIRAQEGAPYDPYFLPQNQMFYCSELLQEAWPEVFKLLPMYYGRPDQKGFSVWNRYFSGMKIQIPEGLPGLSPLGVYLMGLENGLFKPEGLVQLKEAL